MKTHLLFLKNIGFNSIYFSKKITKTFYIALALIFSCFTQLNAQIVIPKTISVTASCIESDLGAYSEIVSEGYHNYTILENGKASFITGTTAESCNEYTTEFTCTQSIPSNYFIRWNGTEWEWGYKPWHCQWFIDQCIPGFDPVPADVILATNTQDTTLPPANDWVMTSSGCVPTLSGTGVESDSTLSFSTVNNDFNSEVSFYPNPTTEGVRINLGDNYSFMRLELLNLQGQKIATQTSKNTSFIQLNIKEASGIYLLKLTDGKGKHATLKVVKE